MWKIECEDAFLESSQRIRKKIRKKSKFQNWAKPGIYVKQIIIGIPNPKFERKMMKNEARIAKTKFDLFLAIK